MTLPLNRTFTKCCYVAAIGVFILWGLYSLFIFKIGKTGANGAQLYDLTEIGVFLHQYARHHDGNFPAQLADLAPSEMPPLELEKLQYANPQTHQIKAWTYFPGYAQSNSPDLILAASPEAVPNSDQKSQVRFVLFVNGEVREVNEANYETKLAAQKALPNPNAR